MFSHFKEREKGKRERSSNVSKKHRSVASCKHPKQGRTHNLFGVQDGAPTEHNQQFSYWTKIT